MNIKQVEYNIFTNAVKQSSADLSACWTVLQDKVDSEIANTISRDLQQPVMEAIDIYSSPSSQ